jgi:MFS family permease
MSAPSRTSYRDIALLAACQALLLINNAGLISMNALVGQQLAADKTFATVGASTFVLGSALATMPASLWMREVGRRRGFMTGSLIAVLGCGIASLGLWWSQFWLYCLGTAVIGVYTAFAIQYRFAAAEVAKPADKAKAISWVLAGGIAGGFLGPETARFGKDLFGTPFLGSFLALSAVAIVALAVQSRVHIPPPSPEDRKAGGRSLGAIARQPVFIVAVLSAALGYGIMNLLMTATPLAMAFCSYPFATAAFVIEWHVVGMYAPGFFTGNLIRRFGVLTVIVAGVLLEAACVAVALSGNTIAHFWVALVLLGIGWNFMYTGGTALVTEAYSPAEKAKTQGLNDLFVFGTMAISSFSSGALVNQAGWERMNAASIPFLALVALAALWLMALRRRKRHA